ncbi:MAG: hypothetical protein ACREMY_24500, partial [bacterium]
MQVDALAVIFRQHGFVVGKLAGELAGGQQPLADAEVQGRLVLRELNRFGVSRIEQCCLLY